MSDIYTKIRNGLLKIQKNNKTKISKDDIYRIAAGGKNNIEDKIRYESDLNDQVLMAIDKLCEEDMISPIGKRKLNSAHLYNDFWVSIKRCTYNTEEYQVMLLGYSDKFSMRYYNNRYEEFQKDKEIIDIIYRYLKQDNKPEFTSNELGYYLFRNEKAFEQNEGKALRIIKNIGVTFEMLNADVTMEPFFNYIAQSYYEKKVRKILIIENKDTFFTILRAYKEEGLDTFPCMDFDMLIYGEGQKINKSFELAGMYGIRIEDEIRYFGDIDPAGFAIYALFKERFSEYSIKLAKEWYILLLERFSLDELSNRRKNQERYDNDNVNDILSKEFDSKYDNIIRKIIDADKYIPQEAVSLCVLDN